MTSVHIAQGEKDLGFMISIYIYSTYKYHLASSGMKDAYYVAL